MDTDLRDDLRGRLDEIRAAGLYKSEHLISSPQSARVRVVDRGQVLNLCANNYLGLADHPAIVAAAHEALERWGYGMASVRFICGTQEAHRELEERLAAFLGTEGAILFGSCFDANGGLFEALLGPEDAVISDALNHASIIDGIRLCKARRLRFANGDMDELEARLEEAADARHRLIATDGVFSMDGYYARLPEICDLAERHNAIVMVDDSHAVGFVGEGGRGSHELHGQRTDEDLRLAKGDRRPAVADNWPPSMPSPGSLTGLLSAKSHTVASFLTSSRIETWLVSSMSACWPSCETSQSSKSRAAAGCGAWATTSVRFREAGSGV